ncbi:uncharacterized protein LOC143852445 [Tasmannia lanceolata]|uniref:uncharacterized protein LOC143852445 n=1 Tax=Tasmannia lanceolata TaxID=3420 RepID=UPI004062E482
MDQSQAIIELQQAVAELTRSFRQLSEENAALRSPPQYIDENHPLAQIVKQWEDKFAKVNQDLKIIKVQGPSGLTMREVSLFPDVQLPTSFKWPDINKYDGTGCPHMHFASFEGMLRSQKLSPKQLVMVFQMSLEGVEQKWLLHLPELPTMGWDRITSEFIKQFSHEDRTETSCRDLQSTKQQPMESFSDFVKRRRQKAAQMLKRPSEEDQIDMMQQNLTIFFQRPMAAQSFSSLKHFIDTGNKIDDSMAKGWILRLVLEPRRAYSKNPKSGT